MQAIKNCMEDLRMRLVATNVTIVLFASTTANTWYTQ